MTEVTPVTPNPFSPYATADPNTRHLLPGFAFAPPLPGHLAPTGCDRLAVVPSSPLSTASEDNTFPPGICETCIAAWYASLRGEELPESRPATDCRECDSATRHDGLCTMCRQEAHDSWWARERTSTGLKP